MPKDWTMLIVWLALAFADFCATLYQLGQQRPTFAALHFLIILCCGAGILHEACEMLRRAKEAE